METFIANGVKLPTPSIKPKYTEQDLQSSNTTRDLVGYLHKETIRWGVRKVELEWAYLTNEQMNLIRSATKGKEYFTFQYYSTSAGISGSFTAYTGDFTYSLYSLRKGVGEWTDVSLSFIEQ
jgi:hypothetical protein